MFNDILWRLEIVREYLDVNFNSVSIIYRHVAYFKLFYEKL